MFYPYVDEPAARLELDECLAFVLGDEEGPLALGELGVRDGPVFLPESVAIELADRVQAGSGGDVPHISRDEAIGFFAIKLRANRIWVAGQPRYVLTWYVLRQWRGCDGLRLFPHDQRRKER